MAAEEWVTAVDDGSPEVRVRGLEARGAAYLWELDWRPAQHLPSGIYRLRAPARAGLPELVGESCALP
jgi:hypothetical protein